MFSQWFLIYEESIICIRIKSKTPINPINISSTRDNEVYNLLYFYTNKETKETVTKEAEEVEKGKPTH